MPEVKPTDKRYVRNLAISLTLGIGLIAVLIYWNVQRRVIDFAELNKGPWKTLQLGVPYIEFQSPVPLADKSKPPSEEERQFFQYQQVYRYEGSDDLMITATVIPYHPHIYLEPDAVERSTYNFSKTYDAENLTFQAKPWVVSEVPGKRIDGSFTAHSKKYIFSRVTVEFKNVVRDLVVIVKADDPDAKLLRERMVLSVKANNYF